MGNRTATIAAVAVLALAASAWAQPMGGPQMGPRGGHTMRSGGSGGPPEMEQLGGFMRALGALDLTEEQRDRVRTIMEDARTQVREIVEGADRPDQRGRIMELFVSESVTESELLDVMSQRDQVRDDVREVIAAALVDVHDVLTPDQLERLGQLVEERMGHGGPGGGRGFGPSPR